MKLSGVTNGQFFIASAGHHDCISYEGMLVDGGQPGCADYAGYQRGSQKFCYAEIKGLTFAEFFTDYYVESEQRKYGIWPISAVRILKESEWPDTQSFDWIVANSIWGTRGKDRRGPLRYIHLLDAETDHLLNILDECLVSPQTTKVIDHILTTRGIIITPLE